MVYCDYYILSKFGISVEGIIASAGVVGVAVGFGAQTIVKTSLQASLLYLRINLMLEIMLKSIAVEQL